ncbi:MAG: hypothetical protein KGZ35_03735 [Truepera sp.]|nr:hypothetical protein [Truepera sp.]
MQHINRGLAGILRHDAKLNTAKLALLRSLNDIALSYAGLEADGKDVVVPLRMLAEFWVAYYWAFMDKDRPIFQGPRARRSGKVWNDFAFRKELTELKKLWMATSFGSRRSSDGYVVVAEMKASRASEVYSPEFVNLYRQVVRRIVGVIKYPIQYAGPGNQHYSVFPRPAPASTWTNAVWLPKTLPSDQCLLLSAELWQGFKELSLWIEALCIHEWSLFTERVRDEQGASVSRGEVYTLLTERPDNRRPLTWERNQIDILLMEGRQFSCPWTGKRLRVGSYDLDHIIPVSVYPTNEMWNLVPADSYFNSHRKRARLPTTETLDKARPALVSTYVNYRNSDSLSPVFDKDTSLRFGLDHNAKENVIARAVANMVAAVADSRNVARF